MNIDWVLAWPAITNSPIFGMGITLLSYEFGRFLYLKSGGFALFQPILVSVMVIGFVLMSMGIPYDVYFKQAESFHLFLGPLTVALAIPLYINIKRIRQLLGRILVTLIVGGTASIGSAMLVLWIMGGSEDIILSMAAKSVTTPIAISITEEIGGYPSLAVTFVIAIGILGVAIGPWFLRLIGVTEPSAKGFALGITSHALGTAKALEMGDQVGAFSALAMGLMGIASALALPWLAQYFL